MNQTHKELLWLLRRWNLVKGQPCPNELFNDEVYVDLAQYGWVERDDKGVYITNAGLEAVKEAEAVTAEEPV